MRIMLSTERGPLWDQNMQVAHELGRLGHQVVLAVEGSPDFGQRWQVAAAGATLAAGPDGPGFAPWLASLAKREGVEVLHATAFAHAAAADVPVVLGVYGTEHGRWQALYGDEEPPEELDAAAGIAEQALERAAIVVAPSRAVLSELDWYGGVERAVVVPPAVTPVLASGDRQAQVLCAGPLWDEAQGAAVLDDVAQHVPWSVRAAGPTSGPGGKSVFHNLLLLGDLPRAQMARELAHAGLFVDPAFYEPTQIAATKAGARGAPLLLSDVPGRKETWGDAAAYFPPGEPEVLREALTELIHDPEARAEMSALALQHTQQHTTADMVSDLIGAYAHCTGQQVTV